MGNCPIGAVLKPDKTVSFQWKKKNSSPGFTKGSVGFPQARVWRFNKVCKEMIFLQIMYNLFSATEEHIHKTQENVNQKPYQLKGNRCFCNTS